MAKSLTKKAPAKKALVMPLAAKTMAAKKGRKKPAPQNHRMPWSAQEDKLMRKMVKDKMTAAAIAAELGRSAAAIQQRLMMSGISLRAARKAKTRKAA